MEKRVTAGIAVLIASIFFLDRMLEADVSASVLYVLPIILTLGLRSTRALAAITAGCVVATLLDSLLDMESARLRMLWPDDFLAVVVVLTTASLVWRQMKLAERERDAFESAESERQRLALIHSVASATSGSLDLDSVLRDVAESMARMLSVEAVLIWLTDESGREVRPVFYNSDAYSKVKERFEAIRWETSPLAVAEAIRRRSIVTAGEGVETPPETTEIIDMLGAKTAVLVPLFTRERLVGALTLATKSSRRFSPDDFAMIETVGRQVAIAIENARLFGDVSKQRERLAMINRIGQIFASTLDLEQIYLAIREILSQVIDCESLLVSFYHPEDQTIRCVFAYTDGNVLPVDRFESLKLGSGPQSECIRTARPLIVDNIVTRNPGSFRYVGDSDVYPVAILYVPMIAEEQVIGVIQAQSIREGIYTEEDVPLLSIIANQAASAILNARLYKDAVEGRSAMERANRIKDEFLATLSHELRTPLTPILGWTQILSRIKPDDTDTLRHAVSVIERNARFQTRLVNDLLDMSRIESGKLAISIQPCDLNATVSSVLESLRNDAASREIFISSDLSADRMIVPADPARLEQIINNLFVNALKFTEEGGRVMVSTERRDDVAVLVCSDTGIGIDEEFLPYVFDRFRQADSSTRRRHSGLGLGLSIVRSLVEMHGGSIEARSEGPGQGTAFIVRLPLATTGSLTTGSLSARDADATERDQTSSNPQSALPGLRVLIVEDDADTLEMMRALCERQGLSVTETRSVQEALEAVNSRRPDLIISDISLPGIDGLELARRLRAESRFRHIPMIALSGLVTDEYRARAREAGFDMHMGKPIVFESLFGAVNELLRRKTHERAESKSAERSD